MNMHRDSERIWALTVLILCSMCVNRVWGEMRTISFPSDDGLRITADLYLANKNNTIPFIVLFHQAGWSRGEYREIAPRLNELGFNCMAVDLRSGDRIKGIPNETAKLARESERKTRYIDAYVDLISALKYARENYAKGKLIAWGSSYSAALVLKAAGDNPDMIDGVVAFSPGEYFTKQGKPDNWIELSAKNISIPVFVTSTQSEAESAIRIFDVIKKSGKKVSFIPKTKGNHGSRALWAEFDDSKSYWKVLSGFLKAFVNG